MRKAKQSKAKRKRNSRKSPETDRVRLPITAIADEAVMLASFERWIDDSTLFNAGHFTALA